MAPRRPLRAHSTGGGGGGSPGGLGLPVGSQSTVPATWPGASGLRTKGTGRNSRVPAATTRQVRPAGSARRPARMPGPELPARGAAPGAAPRAVLHPPPSEQQTRQPARGRGRAALAEEPWAPFLDPLQLHRAHEALFRPVACLRGHLTVPSCTAWICLEQQGITMGTCRPVLQVQHVPDQLQSAAQNYRAHPAHIKICLFYKGSLREQRTRETLYTEAWGAVGALLGLLEFSQVGWAAEGHGFSPPPPPSGGPRLCPGALAWLQSLCKVFLDTSPFWMEHREQVGSTCTWLASPPGAMLALWLLTACQNHPAHTACTEATPI